MNAEQPEYTSESFCEYNSQEKSTRRQRFRGVSVEVLVELATCADGGFAMTAK
jgi:hypothetical protein